MSAAVCLWRLLEHCELEELPVPSRTRRVVVDEQLAELIAVYLEVPVEVAADTFAGIPVKEARAVSSWARVISQEERIIALRNRARKRRARGES